MTHEQAQSAFWNGNNVYYLSTNKNVIVGTITDLTDDDGGVCAKIENLAYGAHNRYININYVFGNRDDAETYKLTGKVTDTPQPPDSDINYDITNTQAYVSDSSIKFASVEEPDPEIEPKSAAYYDTRTSRFCGTSNDDIVVHPPDTDDEPKTIRDIIKEAAETYQIRGKLTSDMDRLLILICHSFGVNDVATDGDKQ